MEKKENPKRLCLVLVPFPLQGRTTPMLQLGNLFHSKGFAITIAHTKFKPPNPANHPHFEFLSLSDNLPYSDTSKSLIGDIEGINLNCKAPLQEFLERQQEMAYGHGKVVGIFYDPVMYFAEAVANHMNILSLVLQTSSASFFQAHHALPQLLAEGYLPLQDSVLHQLVPRLHPLRFKDLPVHKEDFEKTLKLIEISSKMKSSSAMIWNTTNCLEQSLLLQLQQHYKVPFFQVGPLSRMAPASSTSFLEEDSSCISWLEKQAPKSVLYVSMGSLAKIDKKDFVETAWGLANSNQPFLWVVRPGSVSSSEWTELLPKDYIEKVGERGLIVRWAPQKEVLAHGAVAGFWTHCGWNSTLESISEGVPMICTPQFFDQFVISRYVTYVWSIGLELDCVLERGDIERSIRRLMVAREGVEMREKVIEMKQMINVCIREGGSSYKSLNDLTEFLLTDHIQSN